MFCYLQVWNSPLSLKPPGWGREDKVSRTHPDQSTAPWALCPNPPKAVVMYSLFHLGAILTVHAAGSTATCVAIQFISSLFSYVYPLLSLALSDGSIRDVLVSQTTVTYPVLWCQPYSRLIWLEGQSGSAGILPQTPRLFPLISPDWQVRLKYTCKKIFTTILKLPQMYEGNLKCPFHE